jgi:hypothetical protein
MGLTVQLEDALAEELRQEANAEQTSPEELANRLMRDALHERAAAKRWHSQNRRRLELIAKRLDGPLTADQELEFRQLQSLAHQMGEPFDKILLQTVASLRREMEQLPEGPVP